MNFQGFPGEIFLLGTIADDEDLLFPKTARSAGLSSLGDGEDSLGSLLWSVLPMMFVSAGKACLCYTSPTHFDELFYELDASGSRCQLCSLLWLGPHMLNHLF